MKIRINADDFGISSGVNLAIRELFQKQQLHSASLIHGCGYFEEAIAIARSNPDLQIGLHFNLTSGKSAFKHPKPALLVDNNGNFKNGFLQLLLLAFCQKKRLLQEVKQELMAQIQAIESSGIKIIHLDGHRHVHFIPGIFQLVIKVAKKHHIRQVRIINESLFATWSINYSKKFLWNGGIIKWLLLSILGFFNSSKKISQSDFSVSYFFSILYSCNISKELLLKVKFPKNFDQTEIMIHPCETGFR
jgi:predicted glycoside hydrolase/deacetylase ChbG (UPF0249 family)